MRFFKIILLIAGLSVAAHAAQKPIKPAFKLAEADDGQGADGAQYQWPGGRGIDCHGQPSRASGWAAASQKLSVLKVAIADCAPYAFKNNTGKWEGISVDLWEQISKKTGLHYEFVELPANEIITALHDGTCDVSVYKMGPSVPIKQLIDFSDPYLSSQLAVAFNNVVFLQEAFYFLKSLSNNGFAQVFLAMIMSLIFFSIILWFVERKNSNGHFSGNVPNAVGSALWFGAVTMTSIGYGDKIPQTFLGRAVTFIWMITGMMLIAVLTGVVVSSVTLAEGKQTIKHISELAHYRVGVVDDGYGADALHAKGIYAEIFPTFKAGLQSLEEKKISAFVSDNICLQYLTNRYYPGRLHLSLVPSASIYRSFGLRPHLLQKKAINLAMLEITSSPEWNSCIEKWTGPL